MKAKLAYVIAIMLACVVACTACAGCITISIGEQNTATTPTTTPTTKSTDDDPFVGIYVKSFTDGDWIYEIKSDGTYYSYFAHSDGQVDMTGPKEWTKTGDNRYESGKIIFSLSSNGYTMYTKSEGNINAFDRLSTYKIPTPSPTK